MPKRINYNQYIGKKFNRLTVRAVYNDDKNNVMFICKCDCGNTKHIKAWLVLGEHTKSCGCLKLEAQKIQGHIIGKHNRKYEEVCTFCGRNEHYAKSYCKVCYARYRKHGRVEYKELKHKRTIHLTPSQIKKGLDVVYFFEYILIKNKVMDRANIWRYKTQNRQPSFRILKRCFDYLGLDIFNELWIDDKYRDDRKYKV